MGIISVALTALGPWLPAVSAIRKAGLIAAAVVAVIAGAWAVLYLEKEKIEERANAIVKMRSLAAENAALKEAAEKAKASEMIGSEAAKEWAEKLAAAEAAKAELERLLTAKVAQTVCFPSQMVEALNR